MKWSISSTQLKIGLMDFLLLIILNIVIPSVDVFSDIQSAATFFRTGRNCYYTGGERNWTYSQCNILPTLLPEKTYHLQLEQVTALEQGYISKNISEEPNSTTPEPLEQGSMSKTGAIPEETNRTITTHLKQDWTLSSKPEENLTKLIYVSYAPYELDFKYSVDIRPPATGWTLLFQFWAYETPVEGSIALFVGTSNDWRFQIQRGKWTNSTGWTKSSVKFHVLKHSQKVLKQYTLSQAGDGRSRILESDENIRNLGEWSLSKDFKFWAKEKKTTTLSECCKAIAVLTSGNSATWRVDYLGLYKRDFVWRNGSHPYTRVHQVRYIQKPYKTNSKSPKKELSRFHGFGSSSVSIRWAVIDNHQKFVISETLKNKDYTCPDMAENWTYSTATQKKCVDETLSVSCVEENTNFTKGDEACKQGRAKGTVTSLCDGKPYTYFGWFVIFPTILTTLVTLKIWWDIEETATYRLMTFPLLLLQVWPQYRVLIIIFFGLTNDSRWIGLKEKHNEEITTIEPMYESALQVQVTGSILLTTAGPWYDNINNLYLFPLASSLWSFGLSLFTVSFGVAKFLRVGPVRFLPDGWVQGLFTWTFLASFVATLATIFVKAFWLGIIIKRLSVQCIWVDTDLWVASSAVAIAFSVFYLPNIIMALQALIGGVGIPKTLRLISRIPAIILIPAFSPFAFGFNYKGAPYISFSRSLTFVNIVIILLQAFIAPYTFIYNTDENHEIVHFFYSKDFIRNTYQMMLVYSLMICLPLIVLPTILLITPKFPRCQPHLDIKTLNTRTWKNEE